MLESIHGLLIFASFIVVIVTLFVSAIDLGGLPDDAECPTSYKVLIISFIVLLASIIFYSVGTNKCDKSPWVLADEPYAVESIVSLGDNNMTNGRYYMRRGYIESDLYYQYMVDIGDGFKANKVRSNNATLYYADGNYRVEWYTRTKKWLYFTQEGTIHKIYIPEGSITDDYSVDLR